MITLFLLLGWLLFLSPPAQAKDNNEVIQKADILFKTEAKESPKAKKPTDAKTTPPQTVTPTQVTEDAQKAKTSTTGAPSQVTVPSPAPSGAEVRRGESRPGRALEQPTGAPPAAAEGSPKANLPGHDITSQSKEKAAGTKKSTPPPSPLPVKPKEASLPDTGSTPPSVPKREVPPRPSTLVVPVSATAGQTSLQEILQQAYECLQKDKKYEARNLYSQALFIETSEEGRQLIRKHLDELNNVLLFSSATSPDFLVYKVQHGDNLTKIAKQYDTTPELLIRINRKSSALLRSGEPLKVLKGRTSILVDKSDFTLTLLLDGHYLKQYPIGLGKNDKTPEGKFLIENKMKEPTWFSPDGKIYAYGSSQNILGTRWVGFQNQPGLSGYGIHGTTEPESVGTESSNGCVRMLNQDVEELYDYVTPGTEVIIQR